MRPFLTAALAACLLVGCAEDVSKGKVEAEVKEVSEAPAAEETAAGTEETKASAEPAAAGEAWTVDPAASKIQALGAKITATHDVWFKGFSGTVHVGDGNVHAVNFEVDMNALEADKERLTGHLKSDDFFDVGNHPTSSFASTSVTEGSDAEGMSHTVKGNLTMRGKTMEVSFPVAVTLTESSVEAKTEFAINRQDWNVSYPGKPDDLIQDKVVLTVELKADKG